VGKVHPPRGKGVPILGEEISSTVVPGGVRLTPLDVRAVFLVVLNNHSGKKRGFNRSFDTF
jgi:hypothetical protein